MRLWKWLTSGPRYIITLYVGVIFLYGVPVLPLLDVSIERVED